ncbi:UNVERIFIED_CONTAM: putative electron transfer flavoprotein subunit [Siphonaria sp. JEL0065]|nr:putative electron transfer flavoprotein subunit [Siphonaria sp. JEL0065]
MALFSDNADSIFDFLSSPCLQAAAAPATVPPPVQQQQVKVDPQLMFNATPAGTSSATATFPFGSDLHPFFFLHPSAMLMNEFAFPFNMGLEQLQAAQQQLMIAARQVQQQQMQLQQQQQDLFGFLDASSSMTLADISPLSSSRQQASETPRVLSTVSTPPISPQTTRHSPSLSPAPESHVSHGSNVYPQDFLFQQHNQHQQHDHKPLAPKVHTCINCQTSVTPMWRRDMEGNRICNACGVYFRMNGVHRVVKVGGTAVQRRRTRVKDPNAPPKKRKRSSNAATAAALAAVAASAATEAPAKRRKRVDSEDEEEEESDAEFA